MHHLPVDECFIELMTAIKDRLYICTPKRHSNLSAKCIIQESCIALGGKEMRRHGVVHTKSKDFLISAQCPYVHMVRVQN